ncbi:thioesterase superfamily protein [Methylocella silvestris BL2]|uniref:Thioesterase superfamily protein n=1 Tax=Methylocella silvestris (strain DSM 15510 / CIP 108128 / LMG 27833 / NCIMB 13906 / BL2) TaxID=395965 RepID=B8EQS1_METSB|nr:thioesterase superfamily protein [Methylocella silvestris BL2]
MANESEQSSETHSDAEPGPPDRSPVIRAIAMPADTNPAGDIFGGWLMAQMDLAAGNVAARRARGRCATVTVEGMTFLSPVFVGDEVSLYAWLVSEGRTSMRVKVEAWRRYREEEAVNKVTEALFVFVAIGKDRKPTPLPPRLAAPETK